MQKLKHRRFWIYLVAGLSCRCRVVHCTPQLQSHYVLLCDGRKNTIHSLVAVSLYCEEASESGLLRHCYLADHLIFFVRNTRVDVATGNGEGITPAGIRRHEA
jgi:hypothetical protein